MALLEQHFDMAIETPDGIKKLRELILTLAMQGNLVPQDPPMTDQPVNYQKKLLLKKRNFFCFLVSDKLKKKV